MKTAFFRDVTPRVFETAHCVGGIYCSTCRAEKLTQQETTLPPASVSFLLSLLLYTEEGDDTFLEDAGLFLNHTALQPIRLYSY
jgi:hypothetical protein